MSISRDEKKPIPPAHGSAGGISFLKLTGSRAGVIVHPCGGSSSSPSLLSELFPSEVSSSAVLAFPR